MSDFVPGEPVDVLVTHLGGTTSWYSGVWFYHRTIMSEYNTPEYEVVDADGKRKATYYAIRRSLTKEQKLADLEAWRTSKLERIEREYQTRLNAINEAQP